MSHHLYNVTRNCYRKASQVLPAIGKTAEWVEEGKSYRELSFQEVMAIRAGENKIPETLPSSELPGIVWEPPVSEKAKSLEYRKLAGDAYRFAQQVGQ